jgi:hypothetical protein
MLAKWATLRRSQSKIPFGMFALAESANEARRSTRLRNIYHRGQDLAWDGQKVLAALVQKHGSPAVEPAVQAAVSRVFEVILWGELAAWKISAELADAITPLEAKMAATSQAHDEARHFYVMHDYLALIGYQPSRIDPYSQRILDLTLNTKNLAHKLLGMQLMIEPMALTIFHAVRERNIEPVLTQLLPYYEKDEARHVGLGTQFLPRLLERMSPPEALATTLFQLRLVFWSVASLKSLEPHLEVLGITAREMWRIGRAKQFAAFEELWTQLGDGSRAREMVDRVVEGAKELVFPRPELKGDWPGILRAAWELLLHPEAPDQAPPLPEIAPLEVQPSRISLF